MMPAVSGRAMVSSCGVTSSQDTRHDGVACGRRGGGARRCACQRVVWPVAMACCGPHGAPPRRLAQISCPVWHQARDGCREFMVYPWRNPSPRNSSPLTAHQPPGRRGDGAALARVAPTTRNDCAPTINPKLPAPIPAPIPRQCADRKRGVEGDARVNEPERSA